MWKYITNKSRYNYLSINKNIIVWNSRFVLDENEMKLVE